MIIHDIYITAISVPSMAHCNMLNISKLYILRPWILLGSDIICHSADNYLY